MRRASSQVTGLQLNSSAEAGIWGTEEGSDKVILFSAAKQAPAVLAALLTTEEKYRLNSSATMSLV